MAVVKSFDVLEIGVQITYYSILLLFYIYYVGYTFVNVSLLHDKINSKMMLNHCTLIQKSCH